MWRRTTNGAITLMSVRCDWHLGVSQVWLTPWLRFLHKYQTATQQGVGSSEKTEKRKISHSQKKNQQNKWRKFIFEYFCGKARINWHNNKWSNHSLAHLFYESLDFTKWTPFWIVTFSFAISFSHQNSKSISNLPSFVDIFEKPQKSRQTLGGLQHKQILEWT